MDAANKVPQFHIRTIPLFEKYGKLELIQVWIELFPDDGNDILSEVAVLGRAVGANGQQFSIGIQIEWSVLLHCVLEPERLEANAVWYY